MIAAVGLTMLAILWLRATVDVNILPDRNPLFVTMSDGSIRNGYIDPRDEQGARAEDATSWRLRGAEGRDRGPGRGGPGPTATLAAPPDGVATPPRLRPAPAHGGDRRAERSDVSRSRTRETGTHHDLRHDLPRAEAVSAAMAGRRPPGSWIPWLFVGLLRASSWR